MTSFSPIIIYLTRKTKKDDVIKISPLEESRAYRVEYADRDSKSAYVFQDTWQNVETYLCQIFAVLPRDRDPFQGVQFSLPAYPTILLNTDETLDEEVMDPIWSMMESVVNGWPRTTVKPGGRLVEDSDDE